VLEFLVAIVLIALNGVFALAELAIVSSRRSRLKTLSDSGRRGARTALALADDPGRVLSTTQIGITLIGILAGAFSGAGLGARLAALLAEKGMAPVFAEPLGYTLVIGAITYLSVVVGELVPKQIALRDAEGIACLVAPAMSFLSRAAKPLVWLLDRSSMLVLRLSGSEPASASAVTEEEIKTLVSDAETAGVIERDERRMIAGVLRLGDRTARALMTPRTDVDRLDLGDSDAEIRAVLTRTPHSRLPVVELSDDNVIGIVQTRDLLTGLLSDQPLDIRQYLQQAPVVPDTLDALDVITVLRAARVPMVLVHDEYGHFEGIVTPADALAAIVGTFEGDAAIHDPDAIRREDGSWLLSGSLPADEMADHLGVSLPEDRSFETVAGLVLSELRHLATTGDLVQTLGWRFEVVDVDGRRIDKVLASRLEPLEAPLP
jgi:putative hemolysin